MRITEALQRARSIPVEVGTSRSDEELRRLRERDLSAPTVRPGVAVAAALGALALTALLTTPRLVDMAHRQPLGPARDRWSAAAEGIDGIAHTLGLDRPYRWVSELRGAGRDPGERVDTLEELASSVSTTTGAPEPAPPVASTPTSTRPAATTTTTPILRTVTDASPLRIFVAGDSQAEFLGQALVDRGAEIPLEVSVEHRISTGLARPDYFNWPAELAAVVDRDDPEAIVLFVGANDYQDMEAADGTRLVRGTPEWAAEWRRRLALTLDLVAAPHRHTIWIGQPPMRDSRLDAGVTMLDGLARDEIAGRDDVTYVDLRALLGDSFRERVDGPDGTTARARNDDGVHLTRTAAGWVADLVVEVLAQHWRLPAQ